MNSSPFFAWINWNFNVNTAYFVDSCRIIGTIAAADQFKASVGQFERAHTRTPQYACEKTYPGTGYHATIFTACRRCRATAISILNRITIIGTQADTSISDVKFVHLHAYALFFLHKNLSIQPNQLCVFLSSYFRCVGDDATNGRIRKFTHHRDIRLQQWHGSNDTTTANRPSASVQAKATATQKNDQEKENDNLQKGHETNESARWKSDIALGKIFGWQ